jgi:CheY-like chemotaxis protein
MITSTEKAVILVVEDEPSIRELMKTCLEFEGFDVITAANGLDGLQRYKENKDNVQVVVTDLEMPKMNGSDMIHQIFQMTPDMKVVVASGRAGEECSGTACLQKPYSPRELTDVVSLCLRG